MDPELLGCPAVQSMAMGGCLRTTAVAGLVGWALGMLLLGSGLLARHIVALPAPKLAPALLAELSSLKPSSHGPRGVDPDGTSPGWRAVHVLYSECRCSQRIVKHLLESSRPFEFREVVLWVGQVAPPSELSSRFQLVELTHARLASFGIEAAPTLLVIDPGGRLRYSGGYTERKQGPNVMDLTIFRNAKLGAARLDSLPIFGCAVSERLKQLFARLPSP